MEGFDSYRNKTVCVTGHTGFKGSWLCEWLLMMGAKVVGYALDPTTSPSHYESLGLSERLSEDIRNDVRSLDGLRDMIKRHQPDFLFHLAAQPLVRTGYDQPRDTFETNVMGTINVLEALRELSKDCVTVLITTDKVYENREWHYAYREEDPLGGYDPYSASKACAEIAVSSYRRSFFSTCKKQIDGSYQAIATTRGGNVIGGGDWALDRIVPDCMRSLAEGKSISVRNPTATRPWQHVLELLNGYLHLGSALHSALHKAGARDTKRLMELCSAFNFGPHITSNRTVEVLVTEVLKHWPGEWQDISGHSTKHEADKLNLTIDKAYHVLGWEPQWSFEKTIQQTAIWYRGFYTKNTGTPDFVRDLTQGQIRDYVQWQPRQ